jgi:hypothetical protein
MQVLLPATPGQRIVDNYVTGRLQVASPADGHLPMDESLIDPKKGDWQRSLLHGCRLDRPDPDLPRTDEALLKLFQPQVPVENKVQEHGQIGTEDDGTMTGLSTCQARCEGATPNLKISEDDHRTLGTFRQSVDPGHKGVGALALVRNREEGTILDTGNLLDRIYNPVRHGAMRYHNAHSQNARLTHHLPPDRSRAGP